MVRRRRVRWTPAIAEQAVVSDGMIVGLVGPPGRGRHARQAGSPLRSTRSGYRRPYWRWTGSRRTSSTASVYVGRVARGRSSTMWGLIELLHRIRRPGRTRSDIHSGLPARSARRPHRGDRAGRSDTRVVVVKEQLSVAGRVTLGRRATALGNDLVSRRTRRCTTWLFLLRRGGRTPTAAQHR